MNDSDQMIRINEEFICIYLNLKDDRLSKLVCGIVVNRANGIQVSYLNKTRESLINEINIY